MPGGLPVGGEEPPIWTAEAGVDADGDGPPQGSGGSTESARGEPSAQVAEADPVEPPFRRVRVVFDLYYGTSPTKVGQLVHVWQQEGDRYSAEAVAEATGFVSFFYGGQFVQRSEGELTADGLRPSEYTLIRGRKQDAPETARFDWTHRKLDLAWRDERRTVDLPEGAQDPLSMLHQLYFLKPVPTLAELDIATSRKLKRQAYELLGEEVLETGLGMVRALHFRSADPDGGRIEVWVAQDRKLIPVRIYAVDKKGRVLDQVVREMRAEE